MYENAYRILDSLPLDATSESPYINYLWVSFESLSRHAEVTEKDEYEIARSFAIVPFHLLFMFALQFKIIRIRESIFDEYKLFAQNCKIYTKNDRSELIKPLKKITGAGNEIDDLLSVRFLSRIREKEIPKFFRCLSCDQVIIDRIIWLIENRDDLAHANGNIEENIEERIDEYITLLDYLQTIFVDINNKIADEWIIEIHKYEDKNEYIKSRLAQNYLCKKDFETSRLDIYLDQIS